MRSIWQIPILFVFYVCAISTSVSSLPSSENLEVGGLRLGQNVQEAKVSLLPPYRLDANSYIRDANGTKVGRVRFRDGRISRIEFLARLTVGKGQRRLLSPGESLEESRAKLYELSTRAVEDTILCSVSKRGERLVLYFTQEPKLLDSGVLDTASGRDKIPSIPTF